MGEESRRFVKDYVKSRLYRVLQRRQGKLVTGMQSLLIQLRAKELLPDRIDALEMFGMHGLWHTLDYVGVVHSLDMFEINEKYLKQSKRTLAGFNVRYFQQDSIAYISSCPPSYNLVIADIPFAGPFYNSNGLANFLPDMIRICKGKSVIVMNCAMSILPNYKQLQESIRKEVFDRNCKDIFFVPRNSQLCYIVVAIEA